MAELRDVFDEPALLACHDAIVRLAARLAFDPNVADDVAQQAVLQVLRAPPRPGPGLKSFLAKVVANVFANVRAADGRRASRERIVASDEALPSTADLVVQLSVHKDVVDEVLRLEEPARTIVFLRFFRDEKPRAIAQRLGEPVATIETRLRRALARLRERLDARHGGDRAAWIVAAVPAWSAPQLANATLVAAAGGVVVGTKSIAALAAALVIVCAGVWIARWEGDAPSPARRFASVADAPAVESTGPNESTPDDRGDTAAPTRRQDVSAGGVDDRAVTLAVRDHDGAPIDDARVAVLRGDVLVGHGTTDARGELALVAAAGPADVFVNWWKRPLAKVEAQLSPGATASVVLPRGAVVSGRVVVDGRSPRETVPLDATFEPPLRFPGGLTEAARDALDVGGFFDDDVVILTTADGRFELAGLERGTAVRVHAGNSNRHRVEDGSFARGFRLVAPHEGAELRLLESASIRGRVVDAAGEPVARADVSLQFDADEPGGFGLRVLAADDGAFAFWLGRADGRPMTGVQHCVLQANAPGRGRVRTTLEGDLDRGRDLGDVRLDPARPLRVSVTDERGAAVVGARVFDALDRPSIAGPSAADGRIALRAIAGGETLHVAAVGFECAPFTVPADDVDVVDVTLRSATALRIRVVDMRGEALPRVRVSIAADAPLWTVNGGFDVARIDELGDAFTSSLLASGSSHPTHARIEVETDDDGEVVVRRMAANVPLRVAVDDPFAGVLAQREVTLARGNEERVEFRLAATPRVLRGRALDRRGKAVTGALVVVGPRAVDAGTERTADVRAETNLEGRFLVTTLWLERAAMWIASPGYGTTLFRDVPVPADGAEQTFVVDDALVVTCRVIDAVGAPVTGAEVEAVPVRSGYETLGTFAWGDEIEPGLYQLRGLSSELVRIRATIAGAVFELEHDPGIERATLVVPVLGALEVRYDVVVDDHFGWRMWIESIDEPRRAFEPGAFVIDPTAVGGTVHVDGMLPGAWRVLLQRERDDGTFETVRQVERVEVKAGSTSAADLR